MRRRLSSVFLVTVLAVLPWFHLGCGPAVNMPFTAEVDDPDYRRGKELLRMGREQEALALFLKVIDQRGGAAAESHLEAGILYQKHIKDPIAAIYHYRRYRELRPSSEQARLVLQSIEACIREFARTLPAQPLDNQVERTDLIDALDQMRRENLELKEQLAEARAAVIRTTRPAAPATADFGMAAPALEPSQGGFALEEPGAPVEYAAPVAVTPVAPPAPVATPPPAPSVQARPVVGVTPPAAAPTSFRRHVVNKGDTLMSISLRYYGNRTRWREIYAANRDVLPSESALKIGMELKIPQ
ncbi:MAG: LysM peptidoglycan-binding domain-containing protein [Opitutaceae bacterium]|jgi:LysM repeat protein|nr:LysM peptidoglycan-binding domain-containing protein [Opitutaceae bacterium]